MLHGFNVVRQLQWKPGHAFVAQLPKFAQLGLKVNIYDLFNFPSWECEQALLARSCICHLHGGSNRLQDDTVCNVGQQSYCSEQQSHLGPKDALLERIRAEAS